MRSKNGAPEPLMDSVCAVSWSVHLLLTCVMVFSLVLCLATPSPAVVSLTEKQNVLKQQSASKAKGGGGLGSTGSMSLIDDSGFKWFINTNITFSTSSSASGAMSEASYTHAVAATTLNGGTTAATLNDAFDGYNTLCISLTNTLGTCQTGNADFSIYVKNGPIAGTELSGRQVVFPFQQIGTLQVSRKVYVPADDSYARWLNIITNTGGNPVQFIATIANNLGSDTNTIITGTSNGTLTPTLTDTWVATMQNYSGTTSQDPRLAHILQGPGATVPLKDIHFVIGENYPFWSYQITLAPGQTAIVMNFGVGQPSKAAAAAKATELVTLPPKAIFGMTPQELAEVVNFRARAAIPAMFPLGLAVFAILLTAASLIVIRRRSRA